MAEPTPHNVPKLALDDLLVQLIGRAQDVVATQGRLRGLLRANQAIVGNLSLPVLLRRIVQAACELADARYGALGLIDESGGLEQFVHVGVSEETAAGMPHLPEGKGLLGALIADPHPIRLRQMDTDARSVGFPAGHPAMTSFLGVPVRVRDAVFGNLYLTGSASGEFSAEDEELVLALAATAGVAIENARLYEESRRRQDWLEASTEVTQRLMSADGEDPLTLIARHAQRIAGADIVSVVLPMPGEGLSVAVAVGDAAHLLTALVAPVEDALVAQAFSTGQPFMVAGAETARENVHLSVALPVGPVMVLPLGTAGHVRGALVIGRHHDRHQFAPADLEMATTFASHAAVALELADARADQQRIVLLEDRHRIARDLHDHVIQRLFAIGLTVQSVAKSQDAEPGHSGGAARLDRVVSDIDETIRQTRTSIFELRGPLDPATGTVRARLLAVAAEVSPSLGFEPHLRFGGPVDTIVPEDVADDLLAVLRESLTNIARHAGAHRADVELQADRFQLTLDVRDDGAGIGFGPRRSGLRNLRERAERHGGSLTITTADPTADDVAPREASLSEGTRLRWTIPLT